MNALTGKEDGKMPQKYISLKFKDSVSVDEVSKALVLISQIPGVTKIERIFPDKLDDDQLARLCIVEADPASAKKIIETLEKKPDVEYAYEPPARKPM